MARPSDFMTTYMRRMSPRSALFHFIAPPCDSPPRQRRRLCDDSVYIIGQDAREKERYKFIGDTFVRSAMGIYYDFFAFTTREMDFERARARI